MTLHQMEMFVAILETGSFTKAATKLYVAQPSLSQQIRILEEELGVRRFRAYCGRRGLDETSQLTREGALRLARAYSGPRKGRLLAAQTRLGACHERRGDHVVRPDLLPESFE